jgi:SepF-like predicted cell division protein (DUF552 family)
MLDKILGGSADSEDLDKYVELDTDQARVAEAADHTIHIAEYNNQSDLMDVKDAMYDGDVVLLDVAHLADEDRTMDRVIEELRRVCEDTGGDIVQKGDEQVIIAPRGIAISRKKLTE